MGMLCADTSKPDRAAQHLFLVAHWSGLAVAWLVGSPEDGLVVGPGGIGQVDRLGPRPELLLHHCTDKNYTLLIMTDKYYHQKDATATCWNLLQCIVRTERNATTDHCHVY